MTYEEMMQQARRQQAFNALGSMGGSLMAASMGGIRPRDRALLMGQGFQGANQAMASGPMDQMQMMALAQTIESQQAEMERRNRLEKAVQGLMGSQAQTPTLSTAAAQTGQVGPTTANAAQQDLMAGQGGLMGSPSLLGPMAQMYAQADPEGFVKSQYEQTLKGQEPYNLSPGQTRFQGGKPIASMPANPATSIEEYNFAKDQGFQGNYFDFVRQKAAAGRSQTTVNVGEPYKPQTEPAKLRADRQYLLGQGVPEDDPAIEAIDRKLATAGGYTGEQAKAASFVNRMSEAEKRLDELYSSGYSPDLTSESAMSLAPGGQYMLSPEAQQRIQNEVDWTRAKLRFESGAVIGDDEAAEEAANYFPRPGDTPEVIAQKKRSREVAMESMKRQSGGAYESMFAEGQGAGTQFGDMDMNQLLSVDIDGLSDKDLEAYNKRLEMLLGQ